MGRLLVAVGDALHWFRPNNPGPLHFDGENVTVGWQPTLTAKANDASLVEYGHLTLAKKVSKPEILPNGTAANIEYFEHGVQSVREIGFGEMLGLTSDPANGSVRVDVIQPESRDLIKKGLPAGFRRFGYVESPVQSTCGQQLVKKFIDYRGAVFGNDELLIERDTTLPAIFIPSKRPDGGYDYALGTKKLSVEPRVITEEEFEDGEYLIPVILPVYGDPDCPTKVTGLNETYLAFPEILVDGYEAPKGQDITPILLAELEGTGSETYDETLNVADLANFPEGARIAKICLKASCGSAASGNPAATATVYTAKTGTADRLYSTATCGAGQRDVSVFEVELNEDGTIQLKMVLVGTSLGSGCEAWVLGYDY